MVIGEGWAQDSVKVLIDSCQHMTSYDELLIHLTTSVDVVK